MANSRPRGAGRRPVAGGTAVQNAEQVRLVSEVPLQKLNGKRRGPDIMQCE